MDLAAFQHTLLELSLDDIHAVGGALRNRDSADDVRLVAGDPCH